MEKNLKELIAEMDRIEALDPNADNEMQEGFSDALKGVMDKIANKLGYQPKDPELADLFKKYEQMEQELQELVQKIEAHPEFTDPGDAINAPDVVSPQGIQPAAPDDPDPETRPGAGTGPALDLGTEPMGSPRSPQN